MTSTATDEPVAQGGSERRIIVMIGAPGAGKGTQAERLVGRLALPHISTGNLFRAAVNSDEPLGEEVRAYVDTGALVPDDVTVRVLERSLHGGSSAGAILDGFPRTRSQAVALDEILARSGDRVTAALYVEVATDELVARLSGRRICSADDQHLYHVTARPPQREGICDLDGARLRQRTDDKPETVRERLESQLPPMYEVVDYYAEHSVLFPVRGDQPVDDVTEALLRALAAASRES